jgi:methylmalonyl-CoA mutase cobalamin-binding subunit
LKKAGVLEIFTPGSTTGEIIEWVESNIKSRRR